MSAENKAIPQLLLNRYPDESLIDPVSAVTELLTEAGHPNPTKWLQGLDGRATSPDYDQLAKRFLVNRYWRPVLGTIDTEDSSVARYCIMDDGPMYTWLLLFKESVVPLIVKHDLPNLEW